MTRLVRRAAVVALAALGVVAGAAAPAGASTVVGPCGTASLYLTDVVGEGFTGLSMRITDSPAPINQVYYQVRWVNHSTGQSGTLVDTAFGFTNSWYLQEVEDVGTGYVSVEGYYTSRLANGSTCISAPGLFDGEYVD